jgi:hypothetical protein
MLRVLALLSIPAFLGVGAPVRAADDQPKDVIARAIKAHGGEELLAKSKAGTSAAKGKMNIPGVGDVEFNQESCHMLPDKFKETIQMTIMGTNINVVTIVNGDKQFLILNGKEMDLDDATKESLKGLGHMLKLGRLTSLLKDKDYELSLIGEDKVEDKPAIGVRVTTKGQKDVSMWFDKKTNLLAKLEYRGTDPFTKGEVNEERIIAEYMTNKDGIPMPKKVIIKHDGKAFLEIEMSDAQLLEKIDDAEFKKP